MGFKRLVVLILYLTKLPIQNKLNKFFKKLDIIKEVPTSSSYTQARKKLKPEIFELMNDELIRSYYVPKDETIKKYKGHRLLAIDGSVLNLPDTKQTRERFSIQETGFGKERVQALGSFMYDALNNLIISSSIDRKKSEDIFIYEDHKKKIKKGDILTLDRGYVSFRLLGYCAKHSIDYLIRFSSMTFKPVMEFMDSNQEDIEVEIEAKKSLIPVLKEKHLPSRIRIRLIKVRLSTGETEILGTSLLDTTKYPTKDFKELYFKRWGIETYFNKLKNIFEIERFSGKNLITILQDFYGIIFLANIESVISQDADEGLKEQNEKVEYQVNHSVGYSALLDYTVELFMDETKDIEKILEELKYLLMKNPVLRRNGRYVVRKKSTISQQLWFHKYTKRICA